MKTAVVVILFGSAILNGRLSAEEYSKDKLINGAVARSKAISSGIISFHYTDGFPQKSEQLNSLELSFYLSGESWMRKSQKRTHINHGGCYFEIVGHPQPDGIIDTVVHIYNGRSFQDELPAPPVFVGSAWYPSTLVFLSDERGKVKVAGKHTMNQVLTYCLECEVSKDDVAKAFQSVTPALETGGKLRMYVAPSLGFSSPLIEYLDKNGNVGRSFKSEEYEDFGGIKLPRVCTDQSFKDGKPAYMRVYSIVEVKQLNKEVSENEFCIEVPAKTQVADTRQKGGARVFEVTDSISITKLPTYQP